MAKAIVPARFAKRLATLSARQAKVRDDLRVFQGEVDEYLDHNEEAKEALDTAIDALSRLA